MECVTWDAAKWGKSYEEFERGTKAVMDNKIWFYEQLDKLREKYLGKWVAIKGMKIIGVNESFDILIATLRKKEIDLSDVQFEVVTPENFIRIL
jgi:hypothetical protein